MRARGPRWGGRGSLGRPFAWLWGAYAVSTFGTWIAFDAFSLIAILVLHAGPAQVSVLAAAGLAVAAAVAVPLGPWIEHRRKRPVMIAMDLTRLAALLTVPVAYWLGALSFAQLLIVSVVVGAADIAFRAAGGAFLKNLLAADRLLVANARLESTTWTATLLGPPLGGAAMGLLGPVITVVANAASFLLSALGLREVGGAEPVPDRAGAPRLRPRDLLDGWRYILGSPALRPLFLNSLVVNGLIMASGPLMAVLMVGDLGFAPWQYALAFAAPCVGGLIGSRLAPRLVARHGRRRVILLAGALRACWSIGLALVGRGVGGIALVIGVQLGLVTCAGVFNPVLATARLDDTAPDRVARVLSAWTVSTRASIAAMTALWGVLAGITGPRTAIAVAGLLLLASPLLLPWGDEFRELVRSRSYGRIRSARRGTDVVRRARRRPAAPAAASGRSGRAGPGA